jgi:alpha-ribazole phosphatase
MILWTLRHTKPYNPTDVCYGQSDFDVSPTFDAEFPPALEVLKKRCHAQSLYSSPLKRCKKLAEKASAALDLPLRTADPLREVHYGSWESVKLSAVPKEEMSAWKSDLRGYRFPGGESFRDVDVRIGKFIESLVDNGDEDVLFVTHAGVIAAIEHSICGVPDSEFVEGEFPYAMVTRFDIQKGADGKLGGTFETLYGGIQQASLAEAIKDL